MKMLNYHGLQFERVLFDLRRGLPFILCLQGVSYFIWAAELFQKTDKANILLSVDSADQTQIQPPNGLADDWENIIHSLICLLKKTELLPAFILTDAFDEALSRVAIHVNLEELLSIPSLTPTIERMTKCHLPTEHSDHAYLYSYRIIPGFYEYYALVFGDILGQDVVNLRIHAECFTGDFLGSLKCDCGGQLQKALALFGAQNNGVLIYSRQEGRNIGLLNKMRAYSLQEAGMDTADANISLGFDIDERDYHAACLILQDLDIQKVNLFTNNKTKIDALKAYDIDVVSRKEHFTTPQKFNEDYLKTKQKKMGHFSP